MLPHSNWLGHSESRRLRICPLGLTLLCLLVQMEREGR